MAFQNLFRAGSLTALVVATITPSASAQAWTAKSLYHLQGADYGNGVPDAVLLSKGNLYTAVADGGAMGCGSVVQLSPQGQQWNLTVLYQFAGGAGDGCRPLSALIEDGNGALYGTTYGGGSDDCLDIAGSNCGTVYRLTPSGGDAWKTEILYKFKGGDDGFYPTAPLRFGKKGVLIGTSGGYCGHGGATVFTLTPPKKKKGRWIHAVIYGAPSPIAAAVTLDTDGNLYGTEGAGCTAGRVFKLDNATWKFHSLHDFTGGSEGTSPTAGVILDQAGVLYGTTLNGGDANLGTVYSLTPPKQGNKWKLKTLHSFTGPPDGASPNAELTLADDGTLFGTTTNGGANNYGAVFQLTKKGKESVIWSFQLSGPEGYYPNGPITIQDSKTLYGTTYYSDVFQLTK